MNNETINEGHIDNLYRTRKRSIDNEIDIQMLRREFASLKEYCEKRYASVDRKVDEVMIAGTLEKLARARQPKTETIVERAYREVKETPMASRLVHASAGAAVIVAGQYGYRKFCEWMEEDV